VEYALILVLLAVIVILVLSLMGRQIQSAFQDVADILQGP
jgi:Flp pilus assembly pilin Flp